jgi:AcrR family transcriptional regulator
MPPAPLERKRAAARAAGRAAAAPNPRREAILAAAQRLFLQYGHRRTSMDLLAAEAQVAKPTLYAHFADKDAVFRAVVEAVMGQIVAGVREAAAREGPLAERIAGVLVAKFGLLYQLLHASPHATELLDSKNRLGADVVARHDAEVRRVLAGLVAEGVASRELAPARAGLTESGLVEALLRLGHGAAYGGPTAAAHRRHLHDLVRLAIAGAAAR